MPFLAPLIPLVMSIAALPAEVGGLLAPVLGDAMLSMGLPTAIAGPLSGFLSPEIIGGGLGAAFGGKKGLEEGLLGGATLGGGFGDLTNLAGGIAGTLGAPAGVTNALNALSMPTAAGGQSVDSALMGAASPFINQAIAGMPAAPLPPTPPRSIASPVGGQTVGATPPGGPSGLSLTGNTAPQVGPWLSNFWNPQGMNMPGNVGNMPSSIGSAAPATSQLPSATNQQQLTSP